MFRGGYIEGEADASHIFHLLVVIADNHKGNKLAYRAIITYYFRYHEKRLAMEPSMLETIRAFFASQPVVKAWLFGSYSRGEQTEESDIDILVDFDREHATIGLFEYVRMINKLKALTGKEIDLVENGSLLPFADETAQRDKLLIYERGC